MLPWPVYSKFATEQLSKSRLLIDGTEVVVNSTPNNVVEGSITLEPGLHDIQLLFEDLDNFRTFTSTGSRPL